ncbi:PREDICTED: interleukin-15 isoform X2 [Myotis davidii]|uniref:interleukin-15 isoform X2 n=1 Tax=Myotis davidii TaxID=225400 RepID=UPI000767C43A|nr:PREDICTED: interleukin-15 isoform X2 [Myotis davidii]
MLVLSQDTEKSMLAYSQPTGSHKPYLRSTSIQCYLCLLLNSHFLTEAGIHVFIWSCISASLPKTEANWQDVISDLKKFENLIQPNCKVTAMKCFLLELHVIWQESNNMDIREVIENLIILTNSSLSSNGTITESGCKECEELEEKNVKEFLRSFVNIVQMFIGTS